MRTHALALAAFGLLAAAGCNSAGTSTNSNSSFQPPTATQNSAVTADGHGKNKNAQAGVDAVNALGSPVKTYADTTTAGGKNSAKDDVAEADHSNNGTCNNGVENFVPDRHGDPSSTENLYFFDSSCSQLARDVVRKWTPGATAGTETVDRTAANYAQGNATVPTSVKTTINNYTNGTFNKNGYPIAADGFLLEATSDLVVASQKNIVADTENVMMPTTTNVNNYCMDSAGYNSVGIPRLDESFGWQGGAFTGGTRTANADGSTTWSATHAGQTEYGPAGTLGIATGTDNTACPIVTPAYTLTGGTFKGTYSLPISVTNLKGHVINLTVTNGSLANGDTLNVVSSPYVGGGAAFINGTVANGATTIATFTLNGWGDGTLTITSNHETFPIQDWSVVR